MIKFRLVLPLNIKPQGFDLLTQGFDSQDPELLACLQIKPGPQPP